MNKKKREKKKKKKKERKTTKQEKRTCTPVMQGMHFKGSKMPFSRKKGGGCFLVKLYSNSANSNILGESWGMANSAISCKRGKSQNDFTLGC